MNLSLRKGELTVVKWCRIWFHEGKCDGYGEERGGKCSVRMLGKRLGKSTKHLAVFTLKHFT